MKRITLFVASAFTLSALAFAPPRTPHDAGAISRDTHETTQPTSAPATSQPAKKLVAILLGTYHGTVVDDDETVPCVTSFHEYYGRIEGTYAVREGKARYEGTLDEFKLLSDERRECRFRWHDKNGTGLVTVRVTPDGTHFDGSWGLEVVQNELVWNGTLEGHFTHGSN